MQKYVKKRRRYISTFVILITIIIALLIFSDKLFLADAVELSNETQSNDNIVSSSINTKTNNNKKSYTLDTYETDNIFDLLENHVESIHDTSHQYYLPTEYRISSAVVTEQTKELTIPHVIGADTNQQKEQETEGYLSINSVGSIHRTERQTVEEDNTEVESTESQKDGAEEASLEITMSSLGGTSEGGIWPGDNIEYTITATSKNLPIQDLAFTPFIPEQGKIVNIKEHKVIDYHESDENQNSATESAIYNTLTTPIIVDSEQGQDQTQATEQATEQVSEQLQKIYLPYLPSESTIIITYVVEILPSAVDDSLFTSSCDISVSGLSMGTIENIEYITVPWDTEMQLFCSIDFGEETIEENEKQAIKDKIEKVGISVVDEKIEGTICIFGLNVSSDMSVLDAVDIVKSLDSRIIAVMPNIVLDVFDDDMIDGKEVYTETQSAMTTEATNTTEIPLTAEIAEPSQINKITSLPNDPLAIYSDIPVEPNQYYLYKAGFTDAWYTTTTNKNITVSAVDTGCLISHEDLAGNIIGSYDATTGTSIPRTATDNSAHGTSVNGIIGAVTGNGTGIAGAAYNASLYPIKASGVNDIQGTLDTFAAYTGLQHLLYRYDNGVLPNLRVINLSFGTGESKLNAVGIQSYQNYIQPLLNAFQKRNILVIAAAGNGDANGNPMNEKTYPACMSGCMSVMALDEHDNFAPFSNYGSWCDIATYGTNIWTTSGTGGYGLTNGTSVACPIVSAAACLLYSAYPSASVQEVEDALKQSSLTITANQKGWRPSRPVGSLNVANALNYLRSHHTNSSYVIPAPNVVTSVTANAVKNGGTVYPGTNIKFSEIIKIQNAPIFNFQHSVDLQGLKFLPATFEWGKNLVSSPKGVSEDCHPTLSSQDYPCIIEHANKGFATGNVIRCNWQASVPSSLVGKTITLKFITTGKTSAVGGRNVSKTTTFSFRVVKPVDEGTLSLSKTSTNMKQNQTVEAGETVKYKIVVLAKGKAVPNINIEDTLPTGLKLTGNISSKHTGKSSSGGTISISTSTKSNTLTMNVFSGLAAGAKVEFTYSCKVSQSTTTTALKNTAKAVGGTYADRTASASFSVIVQGTPPMPFSDVLTNAWYSDAVMWAWQNNFITGYAGTSLFGPNDRLTRGQAAVILWRRYGGTTAKNYNASSSKNSTPFSDNANGQYYTEAINWAYKNRIMTGYSGKKIVGVYDTITRQQMCVIMYRCAVNLSHQSSSYSEIKYNSYPDRTNVALYAKAAVAWCVDKGVISGWDNKYLMPQMTVDRAQMGQIMMNSYEKKLI